MLKLKQVGLGAAMPVESIHHLLDKEKGLCLKLSAISSSRQVRAILSRSPVPPIKKYSNIGFIRV